MKGYILYSEQDTVQDINNRVIERTKNFVRQAVEKIPEEKRLDALITDDAMFRIFCEFEVYYRIIFGSQIALLMELYEKNEFFSKEELMTIFKEQLQKRKIDFDVDFDKWLSFLINQELIFSKVDTTSLGASLMGNLYAITDKGVAFLTFIKSHDYDMKETGV